MINKKHFQIECFKPYFANCFTRMPHRATYTKQQIAQILDCAIPELDVICQRAQADIGMAGEFTRLLHAHAQTHTVLVSWCARVTCTRRRVVCMSSKRPACARRPLPNSAHS